MIELALLLAFATFGLVSVVRKLPRVHRAVVAGTKPWACDACFSFWAALAVYVGYVAVRVLVDDLEALKLLAWGAAVGACILLLTWSNTLAPAAFELPALPCPGCDQKAVPEPVAEDPNVLHLSLKPPENAMLKPPPMSPPTFGDLPGVKCPWCDAPFVRQVGNRWTCRCPPSAA